MNKALDLLKKYWRFDSFRGPQEEIIKTVLDKKDVFVLLPTGAGKSICYQIPALLNEGVCLVISPLIALMEDQVRSLENKGIKALALTSKYNKHESIIAFDNLIHGHYKFLYLSPEKLQSDFIQEKIAQLNLNLIAIDEAHCISEWGHDFRSAYLKISVLDEIQPNVPRIALTATATAKVKKDIIENLNLDLPKIFTGTYFRDNLHIRITNTEDIRSGVLALLKSNKEPAIIYVGTRKSTIQYAKFLNDNYIKSSYYHGGLSNEQKHMALMDWKDEETKVMVATNAFGMGIDKSNVRLVIHANLPQSLENYIQEIGRAGRDGKIAAVHLFFNEHILFESKRILDKSMVSPQYCKTVYGKLNDYYQIGYGDISEDIFSIELQDFAQHYGIPILSLYNVLYQLHNEDIIYFDQYPNKRSRIKVIERSHKLFEVQARKNIQARVLQLLLRTYGGINEQFIAINETLLSRKLNTTKAEIFRALERLDQDKVISYKKSSNSLNIKFLVPREDDFIFHNISGNINQRNRNKKIKLKELQHFVQNDHVCRQQQLIHYFNQVLEQPCGYCDVCLKKTKLEKINYQDISSEVLLLFKKKDPLTINEIIEVLKLDKNIVVKILQLLMEKELISLNSQNKFYLNT